LAKILSSRLSYYNPTKFPAHLKISKFSRPFKFEIPARFLKLNYTKISNLIIKFCGLVAGFDEVEIMRHTDNIVVVFRISCFVVDKKVKGGVGWLKKQLDQKVRSSEFEGGGG
jgi:hypothetical protein